MFLAGDIARRAHLAPYQSERWTIAEWESAYECGRLDYFGSLPELPRYAMLAGYLRKFGSSKTILDVGCGPGLLREHLRGLDFTSYTGIDLSHAAISSAEARCDERTTFVRGDVLSAALPPVDIVVLNEVLYYAPTPGAVLDAVDRVLPEDGLLLTSMWRHPRDEVLWRLLARRYSVVDVTELRNRSNSVGVRGWRVACHRIRRAS